MRNFIKKYKPMLIFVFFIVIVFFFANKFAIRGNVPASLDRSSSEKAIEFIQLINRLSVIEFDQDFINRVVGDELKDYTVFVPESRSGRENPFTTNSRALSSQINNRNNKINTSINNIIEKAKIGADGSATREEQESALINLIGEQFNELETDLENDNEEINSN